MARRSGFTIVELLIVIVVIAILAAITIVTYNGIQQRARDAQRKSDVANIAKLLSLWAADKGPMSTGSGCGGSGNGGGWFNYESTSSSPPYPTSIMNCLKYAGYTSATISDPSKQSTCSGLTCYTYLISSCTQSGIFTSYIYANLETVPHAVDDTDSTCDINKDTAVGSNYFVKVSY